MPSLVSNGFFTVRIPISFLCAVQDFVWQSGEQIVSDMLARQLRVEGDELAGCFPFGEYPVDEIMDAHICAREHWHLPVGGVFKFIRGFEVQ